MAEKSSRARYLAFDIRRLSTLRMSVNLIDEQFLHRRTKRGPKNNDNYNEPNMLNRERFSATRVFSRTDDSCVYIYV